LLVDEAGLRSGRGSSGVRSTLSLRSEFVRGGLVTAPVGRASTSGPVVVLTAGVDGRASRPFKTRVRRRSLSSGTPGVRVAAPVALSTGWVLEFARAGRPTVISPVPPAVFSRAGALAGKSVRNASEPIARLASASLALCGRRFSLPICWAEADVTARSEAGLTRRRFASSSALNAVNLPGLS